MGIGRRRTGDGCVASFAQRGRRSVSASLSTTSALRFDFDSDTDAERTVPRLPAPGLLFFLLALLLALPLPAAEPTEEGDAIQCANLIYAGTRSSVCFSDRFLAVAGQETSIQTARKFKAVKLGEEEIFRFPFAIMTGEGAFALTEGERVNLRRYLERGGFLLASSGCSSDAWDRSFRREMRQLFPERELEPIGTEHEIFRTVYEIKSLKTKGKPATLRGLTLGGKLVVVYSNDGLNDTGTMHGCCCCGGNEIRNAQMMNVNILAYALVQ